MVKPWKQFFAREVSLSYKYELYYPNTVNNSAWGGFQSLKIVLPKQLEFASTGFILLLYIFALNLNKAHYFMFTHQWLQQQSSWSPEEKHLRIGTFLYNLVTGTEKK